VPLGWTNLPAWTKQSVTYATPTGIHKFWYAPLSCKLRDTHEQMDFLRNTGQFPESVQHRRGLRVLGREAGTDNFITSDCAVRNAIRGKAPADHVSYADFTGLMPPWKPDSLRLTDNSARRRRPGNESLHLTQSSLEEAALAFVVHECKSALVAGSSFHRRPYPPQ
jgi:hypothetical protein